MLTYQQLYPNIADPTFDKARKCLNCNRPIPDEAHATRIHCPPVKINGENFDCKSKRHTQLDSPEDKRDREIIKNFKSIDNRISEMISHKGLIVTWEDLDAYFIQLSYSRVEDLKGNGEMSWEFIYHTINLDPSTKKFKINVL
jgi:hypothetical protein